MKHYFQPAGREWGTVPVYAPVSGRVSRVFPEWAGSQVQVQSSSDVAVVVITPQRQRIMVSYIDALPDALFAPFAERGVPARDALVITRAEHDAAPLSCDGEAFIGTDTLAKWVTLSN